jgi:hypothetical protein
MSELPSVPLARTLQGSESFVGLDADVLDFWRFAMSDLRMNNVRGYLAEFFVARAVGATRNRTEWDAYDVLTPEGIRVEVKTRGHLQAWPQRKPAIGSFQVTQARGWDPETGASTPRGWNADVYVLCAHVAQVHETYDVLDLGQWEFYVLPRHVVAERDGRPMPLAWVRETAGGSTSYGNLAERIRDIGTTDVDD